MGNSMPERTIRGVLEDGFAAITADTSLLDGILNTLDAEELAQAKAYWSSHPPTVVQGYPRTDVPLPVVALVLLNEQIQTAFVGIGSAYLFSEEGDAITGRELKERVSASFGVYIYADHPDVCAWYYRVARRILLMGRPRLIEHGLDNPEITGTELAPDPRFEPAFIWVRRVMVKVEFMDEAQSTGDADSLWLALNGEPEPVVPPGVAVEAYHEDTEPAGGIKPEGGEE